MGRSGVVVALGAVLPMLAMGCQQSTGVDRESLPVRSTASVTHQVAPVPSPDTRSVPVLSTPSSIVPPPAGWPRHVSDVDTAAEMADFVRRFLIPNVAWSEYFVRRTTMDAFDELVNGPSVPGAEVAGGTPVPDRRAVWVIGFRSAEPFPPERLNQIGSPSDARSESAAGGHYEGYVVVDETGNLVQIGTVDFPSSDGTPQPNGRWRIDDIASLPEVPAH